MVTWASVASPGPGPGQAPGARREHDHGAVRGPVVVGEQLASQIPQPVVEPLEALVVESRAALAA